MMGTGLTVVDHMQQLIDAWEAARDQRAIFLTCYAMMTRNMLRAAEAGEFEDNHWVSLLLHRFADYYFKALAAYDACDSQTPAVWQYTFETAQAADIHVMQHLFLGVNAHINYDLVFALHDLLGPEWASLSSEQRQMRHRDHCLVNAIIYQTIDSVQDQVIERYSPPMDIVDKLFGRLDEWMIHKLIEAWREEVWARAQSLIDASTQSESEGHCLKLEQTAMVRARAIAGEHGVAGLLDLIR